MLLALKAWRGWSSAHGQGSLSLSRGDVGRATSVVWPHIANWPSEKGADDSEGIDEADDNAGAV